MAISNSTLNVDVFSEIRALIVANTPYVTNSTTASTTAATINAAYNDKPSIKPQIVINPINKDETKDKFGSNEGRKFINIVIECYYSNTLGIDQLADSVEYTLKHNEIVGIEMVGVTSDYAFNMAAKSKVQLKTLTFTYDRDLE